MADWWRSVAGISRYDRPPCRARVASTPGSPAKVCSRSFCGIDSSPLLGARQQFLEPPGNQLLVSFRQSPRADADAVRAAVTNQNPGLFPEQTLFDLISRQLESGGREVQMDVRGRLVHADGQAGDVAQLGGD